MSHLNEQINADVLEAQKLTRKYFVVELNFSDSSINALEQQFDAIGYSLKDGRSEANLQLLRRVWGSYLGEVIRRKHGGDWVTVTGEDGAEHIALRCTAGDFYPHEQVEKRLHGDGSHSLATYLQEIHAKFQ